MNQPADDNLLREEVYQLTEASLRDEISSQEIERLETLLNGDSMARQHYVEYVLQTITLGYWASSSNDPHVSTSRETVSNTESSKSAIETELQQRTQSVTAVAMPRAEVGRWQPVAAFVLGAAAASIAFGGWVVSRNSNEKNHAAIAITSPASVAYLTSANGCDWGDGPLRMHAVGSAVSSGEDITLYEGMAEFRLANGVYVNVEAPVSLLINSPRSLVLLYGKATLHVPWEVTDFRAIAGACHFAACDAEFGVIHQGNKVDVHVFSGEVRATSSTVSHASDNEERALGGTVVTDDTGTFRRAIITAGSAISLVTEAQVVEVAKMGIKAVPELFATKLTMAGALPAAGAYSEAVIESRPVGYWRFEQLRDGIVPNEIAGGVDLNVNGNLRLAGRVGNNAAEFHPGVNCYLLSNKPITGQEEMNYSLEAWIKPSYVHIGGFVSLVSDDPNYHGSRLEIQGSPMWPHSGVRGTRHPASVRYVHHNLAFTRMENGFTECFSKERYLLRRWQHVVAVKEQSSMRLYLNGRMVASARDKSPLSANSRLAVGQDTLHHLHMRNFVGQIDEVAFYNRALSAEEIVSHFQAPDWDEPISVDNLNGGI